MTYVVTEHTRNVPRIGFFQQNLYLKKKKTLLYGRYRVED